MNLATELLKQTKMKDKTQKFQKKEASVGEKINT